MTQTLDTENLKELFLYPFNDEDWQNKFLIGSLVVLASIIIPIIPLIIFYGYDAQIKRRVVSGDGKPSLPEWKDWGQLLVDGLKPFGVVVLLNIPLILTIVFPMMLFLIPSIVLPATGQNSETISAGLPIVMMVGFFACFSIGMILALLAGAITPMITTHVTITDDFGAAFRVREWWAILQANFAGYAVACAIFVVGIFLISAIYQILYFTVIGCCLMPVLIPVFSLYTTMIGSLLFSQAYKDGLMNLAGTADNAELTSSPPSR